jgi:predicted transposase YdaD
MDLSQNKKKLMMEIRHQKNLKFVLSMEDEEFKEWVGDLPDDALDYLEWLVEETEFFIDEVVLETTGLVEAQEMISKFTRS